jgi:hypothetical protein
VTYWSYPFFPSNVPTITLGENRKLTKLFNMQDGPVLVQACVWLVTPLIFSLDLKHLYSLYASQNDRPRLTPINFTNLKNLLPIILCPIILWLLNVDLLTSCSLVFIWKPNLLNTNRVHVFFFMVLFMFSSNKLPSATQTRSHCVLSFQFY